MTPPSYDTPIGKQNRFKCIAKFKMTKSVSRHHVTKLYYKSYIVLYLQLRRLAEFYEMRSCRNARSSEGRAETDGDWLLLHCRLAVAC